MFLGLTSTVLEVTLDHETLNKTFDVTILIAAMHDILSDTDLLKPLLAGVIMVGTNDYRRINEIGFCIKFLYSKQILIVIVRSASSGVVNISLLSPIYLTKKLTKKHLLTVHNSRGKYRNIFRLHLKPCICTAQSLTNVKIVLAV